MCDKRSKSVDTKCSRFHRYHGSNIILCNDSTKAYRKASYANSLTFSETPLKLGELFLLEIEKTEHGWTGDMRIGLTQLNPNEAEAQDLRLPQFALPDLVHLRPSWIYAIQKAPFTFKQFNLTDERDTSTNLRTCYGFVPHKDLRNQLYSKSKSESLPADVGSRIGLIYIPVQKHGIDDDRFGEIHIIVNGEDQGPYTKALPYTDAPLYVVVDVYGCTKQVTIVQLTYGVPTLQARCKDAILQSIQENAVSSLPLPRALKDYLLSNGKSC